MTSTNIIVLDGIFLTSLGYNMASFNSVYNGGVAFTGTDPVLGSVFVLLVWLLVRQSQNSPKIHGAICALGGLVLMFGGAISHILKKELYENANAFHDTHWVWAVALNMASVVMLTVRASHKSRRTSAIGVLSLLAAGIAWKQIFLQQPSALCSDVPYFSAPTEPLPDLPVRRTSLYLPMSDGVELAVDVYLPNNHNNESLPTFLHLTRYHRSEQRSLLTKFIHLFGAPPTPDGHFAMRSLHYIKAFVPSGYAFVSVDVRGTGASFGSRPVDLSPREVQDYAELADWVKQQPFCNGRIGTGGISYDGIAGALMAAQGNVQAAALLFAPGDIFEDIGFVGGIPTIGFVDLYGKFTTASENNLPVDDVDNELPAAFNLVSKHALKGVSPVPHHEHRLSAAVSQHANNFDMLKAARDPSIVSKDSSVVTIDGVQYTVEALGIGRNTFQGLKEHDVAIYSVAGYYDSASVRSAARIHNYLSTHGKPGQSKLTIGPWTHGARSCWTPSAPGTTPQFPLFQDVKRFFDCKLKDECTQMDQEPSLHYFMSGDDQWKSSAGVWPPAGAQLRSMNLHNLEMKGHDSESPVLFKVNPNATSGPVSRWNLVYHLMKMPVTYSDLLVQQDHSLCFVAPPETAPLPILGSPHITLALKLADGAQDAAVFAYLEEIDPSTGELHYITEGVLRVSHRAQSVDHSHVGAFDAIRRSFAKSDMSTLEAGAHTVVEMLLEPIAYVVPKGHTLQLRLAGADTHNFFLNNIVGLSTVWDIDVNASAIHLPVSNY